MDLKLGHYSKDGIEVVTVGGEIDIYTAPRLRELLIDLAGKNSYQLVINMDTVGFLGSAGLGVLVGGLNRVRAHDGSLDLVCTQERILKIFRITGLTKAFGIHQTVDQAIAARKGEPLRNVSPGGVAKGFGAIGRGTVTPPGTEEDYGPGRVASHAGFATPFTTITGRPRPSPGTPPVNMWFIVRYLDTIRGGELSPSVTARTRSDGAGGRP